MTTLARNEKAVGRAATTAANHQRHRFCPPPRMLSTEISPKRLMSRPQIQERRRVFADTALGAVVLYLLARPLPDAERSFGWALAERWLDEFVEAKLAGEA